MSPTALISRDRSTVAHWSRPALSGGGILDGLVTLADAFEREFSPEQLREWPNSFDTLSLVDRLFPLLKAYGLYERPRQNPRQPFGIYAQQHCKTKGDFTTVIPALTIVDPVTLSAMGLEERMLGISVHLWYSLSAGKYVRISGLRELLTEYGIPQFAIPFTEKLYAAHLQLRGFRDSEQTEQEILSILQGAKLNPEGSTMEILTGHEDVFAYRTRMVTLSRDRVTDDTPPRSSGSWPRMLLAVGLYRSRTWQPLAYGFPRIESSHALGGKPLRYL